MNGLKSWLVIVLFLPMLLSGQPASRLSFDVTSVKENKLPPHERPFEMECSPNGRFFVRGVSNLSPILYWAYQIREFQLPQMNELLLNAVFDIEGRAAGPVTQDECRQMVQSLLAVRFKMKVHRERKEIPVYALVVAKDGPRMTKVTAEMKDPGAGLTTNGKPYPAPPNEGWSMQQLAAILGGPITNPDRPVVDRTGLEGFYKISLDITISREFSTDLATAARRLGLIAEPRKEPFEMLLVDHFEMPDEN